MDFEEVDSILSQHGVKVASEEMRQIFDPKSNIYIFKSLGSTAPREVESMVEDFRRQLSNNIKILDEQEQTIQEAKNLTNFVIEEILKGTDIQGLEI